MARGKFTVNEVEDRTKVPASTLRQWERRYGFPVPERSESGYRLYSDEDIRAIEAMKRRIAEGVPASRAAQLVQEMVAPAESAGPRPTDALRQAFTDALIDLDDEGADKILSHAHALHPMETVLAQIVQGALAEIGQRWHEGTLSTTTEHYATSYVQGRLRALLSAAGSNRRSPLVLVACAPLDQHELGALVLAVLLRRGGYRVSFFGANTPVDDLIETADRLSALAIMISATTMESVNELMRHRQSIRAAAPIVVFGGSAFNERPELAERLGGHFLSKDVVEAIERFDALVRTVEEARP